MCVASPEGARVAATLPIQRIETCVSLENGGLTPSPGMVSWIRDTFHELEQHVLIRQRGGGFHYSYDEIVIMRNDIVLFAEMGVKGVVVGALDAAGQPDRGVLEVFHRAAGGMDLTFHRAFDEVADWKKAIDVLVSLGFRRILTSGQAENVEKGASRLRELVAYADGRIEIMAGGGVRPSNIAVVKETGVNAIHFSGTRQQPADGQSLFAADRNIVDPALLTDILTAVKS